jgi:hypothetical protein
VDAAIRSSSGAGLEDAMKKLFLALALAALPVLATPQSIYSTWAIQHQPAAAAQATISRAAVVGMRHVATSITVCLGATAAQTSVIFNLRDGTTGAGTILWSVRLAGAAGTNQCVAVPVNIPGSPNTAMTLESATAPAATNFAIVSLNGYDTY